MHRVFVWTYTRVVCYALMYRQHRRIQMIVKIIFKNNANTRPEKPIRLITIHMATPGVHVECVEWFGTWSWQHKHDTCSICRESIDSACVGNMPDIDRLERCGEVVVGKCSHVFHSVCLESWLTINHVCPLCNQPWETEFTSE